MDDGRTMHNNITYVSMQEQNDKTLILVNEYSSYLNVYNNCLGSICI